MVRRLAAGVRQGEFANRVQEDSALTQTKFVYSEFYDAPLAFVAWHAGVQYLFWSGFFDDELDDYPLDYKVYRLPNLSDTEIESSWTTLPDRAEATMGSIAMRSVVFDPTRREWIDSAVFANFE